jgi:cystathionine beta-lyase/cystathionine gamma-synthase
MKALESYHYAELAKKQLRGYPGIITFYIKGGIEEGKKFLSKMKIAMYAASLGGTETVVQIP